MIRYKKCDEVIDVRDVLSELLHTPVCEKSFNELDKLPLYLSSGYKRDRCFIC